MANILPTSSLNLEADGDSEPGDFSPLTMSMDFTKPLRSDDPSLKLFDKTVDDLNVVDVYNIASSVGQEFERLTDAFGGAVFCGVMPKIIRILELLESLVTKKEEETAEIAELNDSLHKLQVESKMKDEKQQEEIEVIESTWKDEARSLLETVSTLEEDNQKLTSLLTENLQESANEIAVPEQQASLVTKLQQQISQQRDDIRCRNASLEERSQEIDALQLQIQRLTKLNGDIRNKMVIYEQQAKKLIEEKAGLEARLNSNGKTMAELQLKSLKKQKSVEQSNIPSINDDESRLQHATLDPLVANKLIIDLNDPNRPRYTLEELQEVLTDRNQLKARCFLLEEELMYHRGEDTWVELDEDEIRQSKLNSYKQQQPPSQPQESGIRRFFQYLAGDNSWRNRPNPQKVQPNHSIVDDEIRTKDLVNPNDIKELVPDTNRKRDVIEAADDASLPPSEMSILSPTLEREDFSP